MLASHPASTLNQNPRRVWKQIRFSLNASRSGGPLGLSGMEVNRGEVGSQP
jgi:hypothetical protein